MCVLDRARAEPGVILAKTQQRILALLILGQQPENQTLADAEYREHDIGRLQLPQQPLQHQRAERQYFAALARHALDAPHAGKLLGPPHLLGERQRLADGKRIAVHDAQRIVRLLHVQLGQRAPRTADGVELAALALADPRQPGQRVVDDLLRFFDTVAGDVDQPQSAERQCAGVVQAVAGDIDQFEAAAAEIAGDAVGVDKAHHDALGGERSLFLARQDLDVDAGRTLAACDEIGPVRGLAHGGRGNGSKVFDPQHPRDGPEARQRGDRTLDGSIVEPSRRCDRTAEAAQDLLIEDGGRRADRTVIDHEPHRIGADVDHAQWLERRAAQTFLRQKIRVRSQARPH